MTILVTGANGALGKALMPLLRQYYSESIIGAGREKADSVDYVTCDFSNEDAIRSLIKTVRPRIIFHLAGSFSGLFEQDFNVNTLSAKRIFDNILTEKLTTRVVVFGSAAEYGAVLPSDNPISETYSCHPISVYGLTKNFQTAMAMFYAKTKSIDVVVARVFNLAILGLSQRLFYGRAEAMILSYKKGEIKQLEFGNLDSERDFIELYEAADQIFKIAECGISGEIYNVGSGVSKKPRSILMGMLEKEGVPLSCIVESGSEVIGRKGFDVPVIYADITKVSALIKLPRTKNTKIVEEHHD